MKHDKINLHLLPSWLKYLISLAVIAVVVLGAWIVNGGRPAPNWILHRLIPLLGWIYLGLAGYLITYYVVRGRRK